MKCPIIKSFATNFVIYSSIISLLFACNHHADKSIVNYEDRVSIDALPKPRQNKNVYYFGFDLRASPQEDARQYLPFLEYLENATGYHFKLKFTSKNSSIVDELGQGNIQFAAIGADSYVKANEQYGVKSLVRGKNLQGKASYRSMLIVAPHSNIKSIKNIVGKRFAFGNINSTQGHLIPRIIMAENQIELSQLSAYKYTDSHINCANAVITGKFDVCGLQDTIALALEEKGLVNIIHKSRYFPSSGIAVNAKTNKTVIQNVLKALLQFDPENKHKAKLYNWHKTEMPKGFKIAKPKDYAELREWSIKLGLLDRSDNKMGNE